MGCPRLLTAVTLAGAICFAAGLQKEFTQQQRRWWAFQPVAKPAVPSPRNQSWVRNPIDAFVMAKLEDKGLHPAPPADKITLIRRATLDLTGLPPLPKKCRLSLTTPLPTPSLKWSTACSPRPATANDGRGTGWTWRATPTAKASRATRRAPTSGAIAIT